VTRTAVISTEANSRILEGKTESSPITTTPRGLTRAEVAEVQQLLKKMGLEPGPPDGIAGAKTVKAFSDWAKIGGIKDAKLDTVNLEILRQTAAGKR
jgi:peptidoglycan hydrolase-like protein with peptidoglycan-binding domain